MSQKLRSYFKGKKTYSGDQLHFMDSIAYKIDPEDTAQESVQGMLKLATDANAISRADDVSDGFQRTIRPHQVPELVLEVGGSHVAGVATEIGALKLTPLNYDSGKREDWKLEVQTGVPTAVVSLNDMNVLHIDDADDNGLYLKANGDEFENSAFVLQLKDGGITMAKLVTVTADRAIVSGAGGLLEAATATKDQINALDAIGASKIAITGAGGLLEASTVTLTQLGYIDVTPGTSAVNKAVVLGPTGKINAIDVTALTLNGTALSATGTELNRNAGVTPGTVSANKVLVVDGSKKLDELDINTTFKLGGTQILAGADDINLLNTVLAAGVSTDDFKVLAGIDAGGLSSADLIKIQGAGASGITTSMMDTNMINDSITFNVSFEANTNGKRYIYFPYTCSVINIDACVDRTIEATNNATITFQDALGNNFGGGSIPLGVLTFTAADPVGTVVSSTVNTNNTFSSGARMIMDAQKTTPGGSVLVSMKTERYG